MPVRLTAESAGVYRVGADNAVPTEIVLTGQSDVVFPLLSVRSLSNPMIATNGGSPVAVTAELKPLLDAERLVAFVGPDAGRTRDAAMLFPGQQIVQVRIDTGRAGLLLWPAQAYESLDGILLDAAAAGRIDDAQLAVFLAAGTLVAIRSGEDQKPGGAWPWKREGAYWVLRHDVVGPQGTIENEAYKPTNPWVRGWPAEFRRQTLLAVCGFGLVAVALLLVWRSKFAVVLLGVLTMTAAGGFAYWGGRQTPVLQAVGAIGVWDGSVNQVDTWSYRTTLKPADVDYVCRDLTRPILYSRAQLGDVGLKLTCNPDGTPAQFSARLQADTALAVLSRSVTPQRPAAAQGAEVSSLLGLMANQLYPGTPAGQYAIELPAGVQNWGEIRMRMEPR